MSISEVAAASGILEAQAFVDDDLLELLALAPVEGRDPITPRILSGREPLRADEVAMGQVTMREHSATELKRTDAGRPVYSGGGIEPDRHLNGQYEGFNQTAFGRALFARQVFETYAQRFMADGDTRIAQRATNRQTVKPDFVVDEAMIADFREFLRSERYRIDEAQFTQDLPFIKAMIRFRIAEALFGGADARRHLLSVDPQAQLAMEMLPEAEKLQGLRKQGVQAH